MRIVIAEGLLFVADGSAVLGAALGVGAVAADSLLFRRRVGSAVLGAGLPCAS
jgi:hypothetical protein